jgi:Tn3 transposase DDE domain
LSNSQHQAGTKPQSRIDRAIAEKLLDEQRKIIKYNHLVTNLLIYHNVVNMSRALARLRMEGHPVSQDALGAISPYQTEHINRYGSYSCGWTGLRSRSMRC